MISTLRRWLQNYEKIKVYRQNLQNKTQLDSLFEILHSKMSPEETALWLVKLGIWLRGDSVAATSWNARSRFLFQVLERNPEWHQIFKLQIPMVFAQIQVLDLLCECGLPQEQGLWQELWDRLFENLLPHKPLLQDSSLLLVEIFPQGTDFETLEAADLTPWIELVSDSMHALQPKLEEAFLLLVSQARAMALHPSMRKRMSAHELRNLPWFSLTAAADQFVQSKNSALVLSTLRDCELSLDKVYSHLQDFGVSTDLVFRLEKLKLFLQRLILLTPLIQMPTEPAVRALWIHLIDLNQKSRGVRSLLGQSSRLLAQKIVEKNSETGDHYIARERAERYHLFRKSLGGGFLTAFTVYGKIWLLSLALSPFLGGLMASLNYSVSFLVIQAFGWTLATKQPANTATTIAVQLKDLHRPEKLLALRHEILCLFRSQAIAVLGNLLMVIPISMALTYLYWACTGAHILNAEEAHHNLEAVMPSFWTLLFAAWTGVLLWISSLIAGWADNWCTYRELPLRLAQNTTLKKALSPESAQKAAHWVKHNLPAVASNVSLGLLLGLSPGVLRFLGLPLEVRHVTLSTGGLAASLPVLGSEFFESWNLAWAILGILLIGALNLGISFGLALNIALRAQNINQTQTRRILRTLFSFSAAAKPNSSHHKI